MLIYADSLAYSGNLLNGFLILIKTDVIYQVCENKGRQGSEGKGR